MPIKTCTNCKEKFLVGFDCTDYVHKCNSGKPLLDEEDVVKTGDWEEFGTSGTIPPQTVMLQGLGIEDEFTPRGNRESTHRQRQKYQYMECKNAG